MDDGIARALKDLRPHIAGALKDLRRNWGGAYEITAASGVWRAMRLDNQATLIAIGPGELRDLITADYTARQPGCGGKLARVLGLVRVLGPVSVLGPPWRAGAHLRPRCGPRAGAGPRPVEPAPAEPLPHPRPGAAAS